MTTPIKKSDDEWRESLTSEQYHVCREKGTEPAFAGEYVDCKDDGTYVCVCCGHALFASATKFDSGTGWPSFDSPVWENSLTASVDNSLARVRTEVLCRQCGAHLGHVFDDGPTATGKRYCINSIALKLETESESA